MAILQAHSGMKESHVEEIIPIQNWENLKLSRVLVSTLGYPLVEIEVA